MAAGDNDRQLVMEWGKSFSGNFNGINRTVNGIQLKLVLCGGSPQWMELYGIN